MGSLFTNTILGIVFILTAVGAPTLASGEEDAMRKIIEPLLAKHCYECHSHRANKSEGGLMLDSRRGWQVGGDSGPAITPGKPAESLLLRALIYEDDALQMPPSGKLSAENIEAFRRWIQTGAADSRVSESDVHASPDLTISDQEMERRAQHWSLQPVHRPRLPAVERVDWPRTGVDRFLLADWEKAGLSPTAEADRYTWLRRVTFDLTGVPPTLNEIQAFLADDRPDAYGRTAERLLSSPRYGERWGRRWLDLVRYADSNGADINYAHANAWRYRDYVIRSFNRDKAYDQFIVEQLAGDLIADPQREEQYNECLTATGFLLLGPKMLAEVDTEKLLIDVVDEQLDVTGQVFLGMTLGCARCHDHKFDPVTTRDYYALAGIFRGTRSIGELRTVGTKVSEWLERDLLSAAFERRRHEYAAQIRSIESRLAKLGATPEPATSGKDEATRAVLAKGLPELRSTTWAAWVRIGDESLNLDAVVSADYAGANQGHSLGFHAGTSSHRPRLVWNHGRGNHRIIQSPRAITKSKWHHIAAAFDAETEKLSLWVDGKLEASADGVESTPFSVIAVGRRQASRSFGYHGDVDDVCVFDRSLSDDEIRKLVEGDVPSNGLVLNWNFEKRNGETIFDASPRGNNGVLVGFDGIQNPFVTHQAGRGLSFLSPPMVVDGDDQSVTDSKNAAQEIAALRTRWKQLKEQTPQAARVMAVDRGAPADMAILIRGNHLKPDKEAVPRDVPAVLRTHVRAKVIGPDDNGRLQVARWIADPRHPLTARVLVNRVWQAHFGEGLVRSTSNFGLRGEQPSYPELLDWLASEFTRNQWSIKHLHRQIVLSSAYRSQRLPGETKSNTLATPHAATARLDAEAIRDSLFSMSDGLDYQMGGTLLQSPNYKRVNLQPDSDVYQTPRRAVYLPVIRVRGYEMFAVFDYQTSGQHLPQRAATVVPQQALFMLNNPLVIRQAELVAQRIVSAQPDYQSRVQLAYLLLYGRPPQKSEQDVVRRMLDELATNRKNRGDAEVAAWSGVCHVMIAANEFIYLK